METVCQLENPRLKLTALLPLRPTFISLKLFSKEFKALKLASYSKGSSRVDNWRHRGPGGVPVIVNRRRTEREPELTVITTILLPLFYLCPQSQGFSNHRSLTHTATTSGHICALKTLILLCHYWVDTDRLQSPKM